MTLHGGKLSVFSEGEGKGCTFTIELPADSPENPAPQTPHECAKSLVDGIVPRKNDDDGDGDGDDKSNNEVRKVDLVDCSDECRHLVNFKKSLEQDIAVRRTNANANISSHEVPNLLFSSGHADIEGCGSHAPSPSASLHGSSNSRHASSTSAQAVSARLTSHTGVSAGWPKALHFLVVDDSTINRKTLTRCLGMHGHTVICAVDGLDAINILTSADLPTVKPDVVLMDNLMPRMSGPEATKRLRELGYSGLIIALTGKVFEEDVQMFEGAGVNHVLSKPLHIPSLQAIVNDWQKKEIVGGVGDGEVGGLQRMAGGSGGSGRSGHNEISTSPRDSLRVIPEEHGLDLITSNHETNGSTSFESTALRASLHCNDSSLHTDNFRNERSRTESSATVSAVSTSPHTVIEFSKSVNIMGSSSLAVVPEGSDADQEIRGSFHSASGDCESHVNPVGDTSVAIDIFNDLDASSKSHSDGNES